MYERESEKEALLKEIDQNERLREVENVFVQSRENATVKGETK